MNELFYLFVIAGLFLALLGLPLLFGKVPPNWAYGFRLPQTLNDRDLWYAVNRYGARWLIASGLATVGGAVLLRFVPGLTVDGYSLAILWILMLVFIPGLVLTLLFMRAEIRKKRC